jgi:hypothetical protein
LNTVVIRTALWAVSFATALSCSGCVSGLPAPSGDIWNWVVAETFHDDGLPAAALEARINTEFSSRLPMTVSQFEDMLTADKFRCNFSPNWRPGSGTVNTRDCIYFQRGPIRDNACFSGESVAISIRYSYPNSDDISTVTSFTTRVIMGSDPDAHGSGICFPL